MILCTPPIHEASAANEKRQALRRAHNLPPIVNVPLGEWTLVEEINVSDIVAVGNTSLDYGVDGNWNVGVSLLNASLYVSPDNQYWDPDLLVNIEKTFHPSRHWAMVLGAQIGTAPWDPVRSGQIEQFSYFDNQMLLDEQGLILHGGIYLANGAMSGLGTVTGLLFGAQVPLSHLPLQLSLDYLSGHNNLSTLTLEWHWLVLQKLELGWGVQIAAPGYSNEPTALLGLYWH